MTVRAILETKGHSVVSVPPDVTLTAAVQLMSERRIGAVVVLANNIVEGILSERDVVHALAERGSVALDEPVRTVMTRKVVSCHTSDTVAAIMETMTEKKFRHLPVVVDGQLVGIISIGDVVKWRVNEYEAEQEALRDYIMTT
ncbi:MAG TPA: CBS domain-containing protein [Xanthobacteraceae bacterium]|nr:CBS domain-containing protein [Xanthobacteraceae bacterium]